MTQNRKRGRTLHEDEVEFMPLSKRINNLHINNGLLLDTAPAPLSSFAGWGPGPPAYMPETPPEPPQNVVEWPKTTPQYSPELDEAQNPYYFNVNKMLFEMYVERMQRSGQMQ